MKTKVKAHYYQQFDADPAAPVPGQTYGGWRSTYLELDFDTTALVVMHAWDPGSAATYPGWHRAVEYLSRVSALAEGPVLSCLRSARDRGVTPIHVVSNDHVDYYSHLPGYPGDLEEGVVPSSIRSGTTTNALFAFRREHVFPGSHNRHDITRAFAELDFAPSLVPVGAEPVVATTEQLDRVCRERGIDHLIYVGFTVNGCILINPCGMNDMQRLGYLCSTVADAVTAIENDLTAASESAKSLGLWYVALLYGFVFESTDLITALSTRGDPK